MQCIFRGAPAEKIHLLMEYADQLDQELTHPWYSRDFEATWRDALDGCRGLLGHFVGHKEIAGANGSGVMEEDSSHTAPGVGGTQNP